MSNWRVWCFGTEKRAGAGAKCTETRTGEGKIREWQEIWNKKWRGEKWRKRGIGMQRWRARYMARCDRIIGESGVWTWSASSLIIWWSWMIVTASFLCVLLHVSTLDTVCHVRNDTHPTLHGLPLRSDTFDFRDELCERLPQLIKHNSAAFLIHIHMRCSDILTLCQNNLSWLLKISHECIEKFGEKFSMWVEITDRVAAESTDDWHLLEHFTTDVWALHEHFEHLSEQTTLRLYTWPSWSQKLYLMWWEMDSIDEWNVVSSITVL